MVQKKKSGIEYPAQPVPVLSQPLSVELMQNEAIRKVWPFTVIGAGSIFPQHLVNFCSNMALSNPFPQAARLSIMRSQRHSLPHSKKRKPTGANILLNGTFERAWMNISVFTMRFAHIRRWNTRHRKRLKQHIKVIISKSRVHIAMLAFENIFAILMFHDASGLFIKSGKPCNARLSE